MSRTLWSCLALVAVVLAALFALVAVATAGRPAMAQPTTTGGAPQVELTGSAAGKRRAFAAGRQLTRWRNEPFVQDVQDRLLALAS